ncbi:hypothetical protein [Hirschia litorea]|uniref:DUF2946 domain-containing protein n=1 Tax=Hirschia litorea TaxID=1199156 RepID=A0ABW2IJ21_9PROT
MLITTLFTTPAFIERHDHSGETGAQHLELVSVELKSGLKHQLDQPHHIHSCGMCHMHGFVATIVRMMEVHSFEQMHMMQLIGAELSGFPSHQFRPPRS